ncbi:MAG: GNAT family N-acetyltransferase [Planctomycetota bacterium]
MTDQIIAETQRLCIRELAAEDAEIFFQIYADPIAMRWVDDGLPITREDSERWLAITLNNYQGQGYGMFAIEEAGRVIGCIGITHPGGQPEAEVKYTLLRDCWGRGLASEALAGLMAVVTDRWGLRHVIATADAENLASHRVLEKCGFRAREYAEPGSEPEVLTFDWRAGEGALG